MKLYEKFLEDSFTLRQLLDTYLELRQHFQELGFSEDQLEKPPHYTRKMMNLFHKFDNDRNSLLNDVKSYGFDMNFNELSAYLTPLLEKINELTPLKKNGNNQRSN
jgi:hypothetical protein